VSDTRVDAVAAEDITDRTFTCGYNDCDNDANWLVELRGAETKQALAVCQPCSREHKIWALENELFRDEVDADLVPWEPNGQVHVVCRDCSFEAIVPSEKRSEPIVSVHADATDHEVEAESVDDSAELITDGGETNPKPNVDGDAGHVDCEGCTDDGRGESSADAITTVLERVADELEFQNAVLTEQVRAQHLTAISADEYTGPEEKAETAPNIRSLLTMIRDHESERERADNPIRGGL